MMEKTEKGTEPFSMRKLMSTKMLLKYLKLFTTGESSWENPVKKKTTEATTTTTAAVAAAAAARIYAISPCAQLRQQLPRLSLSLSAVHLQCTLNAGAPVRYPLLPVRCTSMLK